MTNEVSPPKKHGNVLSNAFLVFTTVALLGFGIAGLTYFIQQPGKDDAPLALIATIPGIGGGLLVGWFLVVVSISAHLKARPVVQIMPTKELFDLGLHRRATIEAKGDDNQTATPELWSDNILLAFKIWRLSIDKIETNKDYKPFRAVIRLKYRREMGNSWIGGRDLLIPLSYEEMVDIQKEILDDYIRRARSFR